MAKYIDILESMRVNESRVPTGYWGKIKQEYDKATQMIRHSREDHIKEYWEGKKARFLYLLSTKRVRNVGKVRKESAKYDRLPDTVNYDEGYAEADAFAYELLKRGG